MDWIRLGKSGVDLTGVGGKVQEVTQEELAKHNTENDSWISLRGRVQKQELTLFRGLWSVLFVRRSVFEVDVRKVYNVSQYMEYHPGGIDELMRGSGIDATQLFDEYT
ncbi:hypothetical protein KUTeg_007339 [Tegillarca granosa]|uniref:Cytochrome b5 heme-binding domain-containing protein n=1 Tax=Tegillarca granosa TaxID=220873 RepID=A0ABQ9FCZ9_TEGGR|nr:hypothetical protein KUTeg_007339 [Tegillarca granosa]